MEQCGETGIAMLRFARTPEQALSRVDIARLRSRTSTFGATLSSWYEIHVYDEDADSSFRKRIEDIG